MHLLSLTRKEFYFLSVTEIQHTADEGIDDVIECDTGAPFSKQSYKVHISDDCKRNSCNLFKIILHFITPTEYIAIKRRRRNYRQQTLQDVRPVNPRYGWICPALNAPHAVVIHHSPSERPEYLGFRIFHQRRYAVNDY